MPSLTPGGSAPKSRLRACTECDDVWAPHSDFLRCESCGSPTEERPVGVGEQAPALIDSIRRRGRIRDVRAAEIRHEQRGREVALAPVIRAALATLRYDLDRWLHPDGAAWVAGDRTAHS